MLKRIGKKIADKVFLRSTIHEIRKKVEANTVASEEWQRAFEESITLVERKIDYLLGKIDIYADADDQNYKKLQETVSSRFDEVTLRLEELQKNSSVTLEQIKEMVRDYSKFDEVIEQISLNEYRQYEALNHLIRLLNLDFPLKPTRRAAASPDFLLCLYLQIIEQRPKLVVELGSGVSTIVAAAALKHNGDGEIHSFDHLKKYGEETSDQLRFQKLNDIATVHITPLDTWLPKKPSVLGKEWKWYSIPEEFSCNKIIDLLVVDGPPQGQQDSPYARYPAVPHFYDKLGETSVVMLDDASREQELAIAKAWTSEWNMRRDYRRQFEKGLCILQPRASSVANEA